jgi:hypothetical protein
MAVTSQLRPNPAMGDAWISHWQAAGLLKPSVVKPVFATLEQRLAGWARSITTIGRAEAGDLGNHRLRNQEQMARAAKTTTKDIESLFGASPGGARHH